MIDLSKSLDFFDPNARNDRIHIIGCGSVGANVAVQLVRSGLTKLTLWDFDTVDPHNLANQVFRQKDIGQPKTAALLDILKEINPEIVHDAVLQENGWNGQVLSGFVFLCADSMEVRRQVVDKHINSRYVTAMFDFRTGLEIAQHFAALWSDAEQKKAFRKTMDYTDEEAHAQTPMSACHVSLSVCPTVWIISSLGVANFMNVWRGADIKNTVLLNAFAPSVDAF